MTLYGVAVIPLLIWAYLLLARGGFWRVAARSAAVPATAPAGQVVVLIPARNEAATSILVRGEVVEHLKSRPDFERHRGELRELLGEISPYPVTGLA